MTRDDWRFEPFSVPTVDIQWIDCEFPYSLPRLLGQGLAAASADIIAITEAHTTVAPDWAEAVLKAHHENTATIIGGIVEPKALESLSDWALYYADYGQFLPPYDSHHATEVPGNNVSFKRAIFPADRSQFLDSGFWKTFYVDEQKRQGHNSVQISTIIAYYNRRISLLQLLHRRFTHGRCFGGMQAETKRWYWRGLFAILGLLLPLILFWRQMRKLWVKKSHRGRIMRVSPAIGLAVLAWSLGEWWGTIKGKSRSCNFV